MRKWEMRALSLLVAALMLPLTVLPGLASSATASTIQLVKATGTVTVTNSSGRSLSRRDNMLLYSGCHVQTGSKSYAWINLDSTKLSKLDASSEVEICKSGKKLELLLGSGHIYFNVTSPLAPDETLNVRTSTMVTGIRGTCGWINVVDRWTTEIYVLEGAVQCNVTDPVMGQVKTATVESGEKITAVAYPQDQEGDKCDFIQEQIEVSDINGFVLEELAQDPGLCDEIYEKSGLDILDAVEAAQERVEREQQALQDMLDRIGEELAGQDSGASTDPVWPDGSGSDPTPSPEPSPLPSPEPSPLPSPDPSPEPSPLPSPEPTEPNEMAMPKTAVQVEELFKKYDTVTLTANEDKYQNTLTVSGNMAIPNGKTLILSEGVSAVVSGTITGGDNSTLTAADGAQLRVFGTLTVQALVNNGALINEDTGIIVTESITTSGFFASAGTIEGTITIKGGDAEITGAGKITSSNPDATISYANGKLTLNGGTITNSGTGFALKINSSPDNVTFGGTSFRAKQDDRFISVDNVSYTPEGHVSTGTTDADGCYCLTKDSEITSHDPEEASFVSMLFTVFAPDTTMTRGMLVTILHRMEGHPSAPGAAFADVPDGQWYTDAVTWAGANEIVTGYGNGNYGPNDPITREQMAAILYRYARYKGYAVTSPGSAAAFPDGDKVSSYAADAVSWAVGTGLLQGSDNMLSPDGGATRAQAAVILTRFCEDAAHSYLIDGLADPMGLCWKDGTLYIAETGANRIIKMTGGQLMAVAGSGEDDLVDGPAAQAAFSSPQGVAVGEDGTVYVSDTVNGAVRRIKNGVVTTLAHRDESDLNAFIPTSPVGLAVRGNQLYVCDSFARRVFVISLE